MRKTETLSIIFSSILLLIALIAAGGFLFLVIQSSAAPAKTVEYSLVAVTPEPTPEVKTASVNYLTPLGTVNGPTVKSGESVIIARAPEIDNYTFLYWLDVNGNIETREEIFPVEDTWYSAAYTVALNSDDHIAYLSPDENGFLNLSGTVSRRELAEIIYSLLKVKVNGDEGFDDVSHDDSCYGAVCALKSLNVVSGSTFRPDDAATVREVLALLCTLYPNNGDFSDETVCKNAENFGWIASAQETAQYLDDNITRALFARIMNNVLNRSFSGEYPDGNTEAQSDDYLDVLEACTIHSYTLENENEKWTSYQAINAIKPGFLLTDYTLYYVNENGSLLKNGEVDGFCFDAEGRYTSGDAELDKLVRSVIEKYRQDDGDLMGLIHRVYEYIAFNSVFISSKHFYSTDEIPTIDLAKRLLSESKGNCYNYSAAFIEIVRSLGYDATWVIGNVRNQPGLIEHGWVKMPVDGEIFYFDPEMEPICRPQGTTSFMMTEQRSRELGFLIVDGNN